MAPVLYRPPPTTLIRPTLIAPPVTPVQATSFIPRKLFLQLLAGTVGIFILTVLIWKLPRFLRSFTKARVLRKGNAPSTRYAKTWYGWVPSQRHEANKQFLRKFMAKLGSWSSWGSASAGMEWLWWDPRQSELGAYQQKGQQRVPKLNSCYDSEMADAIWDPTSPSLPRPSSNPGPEAASSPFATGALLPPFGCQSLATPIRGPARINGSLQEGLHSRLLSRYSTTPRLQRARFSEELGSETSSYVVPPTRQTFSTFPRSLVSQSASRVPLRFMNYTQSSPHGFSMPCLAQRRGFPIPTQLCRDMNFQDIDSAESVPDISPVYRRSRKYQVWSARMGMQTLKCVGYSTHTLPVAPPGSPESAVLRSLSLDSTAFERAYQYQRNRKQTSSSDISDLILCSPEQQFTVRRHVLLNGYKCDTNTRIQWNSLPIMRGHLTPFGRPTLLTWQEESMGDQASAVRFQTKHKKPDHQKQKHSFTGRMPHFVTQAKDWSSWEVRLIFNLDRRLEWISNQLTPGQRPFHFALLANHWLNRNTWIVFDPVSRIPLEKRRLWGDPRFNVPYPAPESAHSRGPKYPKSNHRPAQTPKLNSWRLAVNRHRMASGLKPFTRGIELYESSAEDPPDGKIDPDCWLIRRPPQGLGLSARQREKYYEGGAGWQEKWSDWQRIKSGYRVRKAIYEGRVNRTRVKEIAHGVARYCRQVTWRSNDSDADRWLDGREELATDESA
ncbi:hypothetical protein ASPSYDRAFT_31754 [Aspergillus sydowii CBS 593.65]|uniref:Uncharacterized protein n=1 Tax=Aspergillus sydowii CBS 593.65 TaxID=1036612 RepID=A0A1L9TI97_9EURO|nr:uncharacterized protein ASPSYDRAFT_31754 [Aspergillus sydowii CBS 593.65]OJJ59139.1 hypothetical protein ASPSYDRAFT_31754 [Aspergillus sydowii CBS 593.65]